MTRENVFYWSVVHVFHRSLDENCYVHYHFPAACRKCSEVRNGEVSAGEVTLCFHRVPGILNSAGLSVILSIINNELLSGKRKQSKTSLSAGRIKKRNTVL